MSGEGESKQRASRPVVTNIIGRPQYGTTGLATDPAASILAYTVNQQLRNDIAVTRAGNDPLHVVTAEWHRVLSVHTADFPPVGGPILPPASPLPEFDELVEEDLARRGVASGRLRGVKDEERKISETAASVKLDTMRVDAEYAALSQRSMLEDVWQRLLDNEPDVVAGVLAIAFRGNELAARPLEVAGECVVLELIAPSLDRAIPKKRPGTNRKGAPSVVRASGADRRDAYRQYVLGAGLLSAREVVAVAPGIRFVDVSVLTLESKAQAVAGGSPKGLARFFVTRAGLANANLSLPADEVVLSCAHASRISLGRRGGLRQIGLEYDKQDKKAIAALLDPDAGEQTVRDRAIRLAAETLSKSGEIGANQLKRLGESGAAAVEKLRDRAEPDGEHN